MKYLFLLFCIFHASINEAQVSKRAFKKSICKHRKTYKASLSEHDNTPLKKADLKHVKFYKVKRDYQVNANFERTTDAKPFDMATYSGITKQFVKYGILNFTLLGKQQQLAVYQNLRLRNIPGFKDYLFIPFKDITNDETTYGGGRYMDIRMGDIADNKLMLDFNKCYNPWCAFSDGYNCPIPPSENHLEISIEAGEKNYTGKIKK